MRARHGVAFKRRAQRFGVLAERVVSRSLRDAGWSILDRNWRGGGGEIDLVASNGQEIHFIEVKARRASFESGLEAVTAAKRRRLVRAASAWLASQREAAVNVRLSIAVVVRRQGKWAIEWWWDAFDA